MKMEELKNKSVDELKKVLISFLKIGSIILGSSEIEKTTWSVVGNVFYRMFRFV